MLILILFNVQHLQNFVLMIDKGSNGQNRFWSYPHYPGKKSPEKFSIPQGRIHLRGEFTYLLTPFGKPCSYDCQLILPIHSLQ